MKKFLVLALLVFTIPAFAHDNNDHDSQPDHHVHFRPWRTYDPPRQRPVKANPSNPNNPQPPDVMVYYPKGAPVLDADGNSPATVFFCYAGQPDAKYDSKPYFMHLTYDAGDGFTTTCNSDSFYLLYTLEKILNPGVSSSDTQ